LRTFLKEKGARPSNFNLIGRDGRTDHSEVRWITLLRSWRRQGGALAQTRVTLQSSEHSGGRTKKPSLTKASIEELMARRTLIGLPTGDAWRKIPYDTNTIFMRGTETLRGAKANFVLSSRRKESRKRGQSQLAVIPPTEQDEHHPQWGATKFLSGARKTSLRSRSSGH